MTSRSGWLFAWVSLVLGSIIAVLGQPLLGAEQVVTRDRDRAERTNEVVQSVESLDSACAHPMAVGRGLDLLWVALHLIEETARHAGHADATRELLDGATGL